MKVLKCIILLSLILFNSTLSYALDIDSACKAHDKITNSLLGDFSTSLGQAYQSGQCVGAKSPRHHSKVINEYCSEYIELEKSLDWLKKLNTSLPESYQSGVCLGTIYQFSKKALTASDYLRVAEYVVKQEKNAYSKLKKIMRDINNG